MALARRHGVLAWIGCPAVALVTVGMLFACLVHAAAAAGGRQLIQRAGSDDGLAAPLTLCATLLDTSLVATCHGILTHPHGDAFIPTTPTEHCETHVRNLVVTKDKLKFYYVLDEFCLLNTTRSKQSLSFWAADLAAVRTGFRTEAQPTLLSYWWTTSDVSGPAILTPAVYEMGPAAPSMAYVYGLDLSKNETHLFMTAFGMDTATATISWIVSLDVKDGSRVSVPVAARLGYGLALNPNKTALYLSDAVAPPRMLKADMTGVELLTAENFHPMPLITFASSAQVGRPIFGAHAFSADGNCLYFIDDHHNQALGLHTATQKVSILTSSSGTAVTAKSETPTSEGLIQHRAWETAFNGSLGEIATTSDGRHVFVTEFTGKLWRITLDSACGLPLSVTEVAMYSDGGVWGLAVTDDDYYLYVGTADGHVNELGLNLPAY